MTSQLIRGYGAEELQMESEWPASLDVAELLHQGWRPVPFEEFVLKIHSRCDLACDYCYIYNLADSSWRQQPVRMSFETINHVTDRIAEHAVSHSLRQIRVILHGGEPLLAGPELITYLVTELRARIPRSTSLMILIRLPA